MRPSRDDLVMIRRWTWVWGVGALAVGCHRQDAPSAQGEVATALSAAEPASASSTPVASASAVPTEVAAVATEPPPPATREVGPYDIPFRGKRNVYYALSVSTAKPQRLLANLHGMCNPPGYSCGYWIPSASQHGILVCPHGNSNCGPGVDTWAEPVDKIDQDLEDAVSAVDAQHPGEISRDGAFLTGFSLGATTAVEIAKRHPGRWPYLILNEATMPLDAAVLRKAGVRAVALIAGELGGNVHGHKALAKGLAAKGFPVKTWVMPKAGHWYSANIDEIMSEAMEFCLSVKGD